MEMHPSMIHNLFPVQSASCPSVLASNGYSARFDANTPELIGIGVGFVVALLLSAVLYGLYQRRQRQLEQPDAMRLFNDLCTAHGLLSTHKRTLLKLAQLQRVSNPAIVFIDLSLWPASSEAERRYGNRMHRNLCALRRNLFV